MSEYKLKNDETITLPELSICEEIRASFDADLGKYLGNEIVGDEKAKLWEKMSENWRKFASIAIENPTEELLNLNKLPVLKIGRIMKGFFTEFTSQGSG